MALEAFVECNTPLATLDVVEAEEAHDPPLQLLEHPSVPVIEDDIEDIPSITPFLPEPVQDSSRQLLELSSVPMASYTNLTDATVEMATLQYSLHNTSTEHSESPPHFLPSPQILGLDLSTAPPSYGVAPSDYSFSTPALAYSCNESYMSLASDSSADLTLVSDSPVINKWHELADEDMRMVETVSNGVSVIEDVPMFFDTISEDTMDTSLPRRLDGPHPDAFMIIEEPAAPMMDVEATHSPNYSWSYDPGSLDDVDEAMSADEQQSDLPAPTPVFVLRQPIFTYSEPMSSTLKKDLDHGCSSALFGTAPQRLSAPSASAITAALLPPLELDTPTYKLSPKPSSHDVTEHHYKVLVDDSPDEPVDVDHNEEARDQGDEDLAQHDVELDLEGQPEDDSVPQPEPTNELPQKQRLTPIRIPRKLWNKTVAEAADMAETTAWLDKISFSSEVEQERAPRAMLDHDVSSATTDAPGRGVAPNQSKTKLSSLSPLQMKIL